MYDDNGVYSGPGVARAERMALALRELVRRGVGIPSPRMGTDIGCRVFLVGLNFEGCLYPLRRAKGRFFPDIFKSC